MKHISFNKYKTYLESLGYSQEKGINEYQNLSFIQYLFSKPNEKNKYIVNTFVNSDNIISIAYGYGSPYLGYSNINIDKRKTFWKNLMN